MLDSRSTAGRLKLAVARVACSRPVGRAVGTVTRHRIRNHGLWLDTSEISPDMEASLFFGIYEKAEIQMLRRHLAGSRTVVELGSSIGITTAHLLDVMPSDGRIICLEPHPGNVEILRRRVESHRADHRVDIIAAAITTARGTARLDIINSVGSQLGTTGVEVATISLSEVISGLEDFALMCDIEGAETAFVFGDPQALERCNKIVIEMDDTTWEERFVSADETFDRLCDLGFTCLEQHGAVVALSRS